MSENKKETKNQDMIEKEMKEMTCCISSPLPVARNLQTTVLCSADLKTEKTKRTLYRMCPFFVRGRWIQVYKILAKKGGLCLTLKI